jgi:hypothetical protein
VGPPIKLERFPFASLGAAPVLEVRDETIREVLYAAWNRYAVVPASPLSSGTLQADFGALGKSRCGFAPESPSRAGSRAAVADGHR